MQADESGVQRATRPRPGERPLVQLSSAQSFDTLDFRRFRVEVDTQTFRLKDVAHTLACEVSLDAGIPERFYSFRRTPTVGANRPVEQLDFVAAQIHFRGIVSHGILRFALANASP